MSNLTIAVSGAAASGVGAITLQWLGLDPQPLLYGAIGAGVGTTVAPELSRFKAVMVFLCIVCLCALAGTVVTQAYWNGSPLRGNLVAGILAAVFHPLFTAGVAKIPDVWDGLLRKVGLKT